MSEDPVVELIIQNITIIQPKFIKPLIYSQDVVKTLCLCHSLLFALTYHAEDHNSLTMKYDVYLCIKDITMIYVQLQYRCYSFQSGKLIIYLSMLAKSKPKPLTMK